MDNTKKNSSTTGESTVFLPLLLFRGEFRPPRVCRDKYNGFLPTIGGTFKSKVLEESLANKFFTWWQFLHVSEATSRNGYGGQLQREWRLAGRNSITLEKQADPAVTNEMAADDRAVLCAGTNTTGIFLFFPFFFFFFFIF